MVYDISSLVIIVLVCVVYFTKDNFCCPIVFCFLLIKIEFKEIIKYFSFAYIIVCFQHISLNESAMNNMNMINIFYEE